MANERVVAFCHIAKTGGMTMEAMLRRNFGRRHLNVIPRRRGSTYTARDLRIDRKLHPGLRSIGGHALRPFVAFEEFEESLAWFTMIRDPVERFLSHFEHQATRRGYTCDVAEWMRVYNRGNYQVRMLAGEFDLQIAKHLLEERFACVGLLHEFQSSLLLFREQLNLPDFDISDSRPRNVGGHAARKRVDDQWLQYEDDILEQNALDLELFEFVKTSIWPRQIARYGQERLMRDVKTEFTGQRPSLAQRIRPLEHQLYRNLVYKPFCFLDRKMTPVG